MRLLLDTNVLLDGYLKRESFYKEWQDLLFACVVSDVELWASAKSFTDIFYIGRKAVGSQSIQRAILASLNQLSVCSINGDDIRRAAEEEWADFEDCIVYQAARKIEADYIVTRNKQDFRHSTVPVVTPQEFLDGFEFVDKG